MAATDLMRKTNLCHDYWSPGGSHATLLAGTMASLDATKSVLDAGTGSGAGGINLAIATGARVLAIDSEPEYVQLARDNAHAFGVGALMHVRQSKFETMPGERDLGTYDFLLAEGGLASYVGHEAFLATAAALIKPGGTMALSDLVFHEGVPSEKYPLTFEVPELVKAFYRTGGYADSVRHRTTQSHYDELLMRFGFEKVLTFTVPRSDWRAYHTNMQRHAAAGTGPAQRDPAFARVTVLDEALFYTEAQKYMAYLYVIARRV